MGRGDELSNRPDRPENSLILIIIDLIGTGMLKKATKNGICNLTAS
jgi:hypothetical protein